jgi:hypothetical protein
VIHFWIIFIRGNKKWGWRAHGTGRGGLDIVAYRSKKDAQPDLYRARELYGEARLYKFKPESFILGASK